MTGGWGMRALLALLALTLMAGVAVGADADVFLPVDESEMLILEVRAERYLASSGLIGYRHGDLVLLPLGELAAVLEYAVDAYPERGVAEGWLLDEDHGFLLDVQGRSVSVDGRQSGITESCLYVNPDDIYVTSTALARWWPIDLEIDLTGLRVVITPRETVPLIERLNREARWAQLDRRSGGGIRYPQREAPYRLASWPFLDATISYDHNRKYDNLSGSLLSRGDLAKLSVTGFLGYDDHAPHEWTAWMRAGRTDRDGRLLGPLGATTAVVGDVIATPLSLVDGTSRGRGVSIGNRPLGSVSQFDMIDVTGDAPPGWEVELYLDGALHDLQSVGSAGHFLFVDVPLHLGLNTIRTVLYGPNGQTREQVRTYNIRSGMWGRGHLHYNYSSLQLGKSIVGSPTSGSRIPGEGSWDHRLELGYGVGPSTTVGAGMAQIYVDDAERQYAQVSLLQSLGPLFLQAVGVKDLDGGLATSIAGQTRVGRQSLYLGYARFDDFVSNTNEGSGDVASRMEARLSGAWQRQGRQLVSYRMKWLGEEAPVELDHRRDFLDLYLGSAYRRISLGHQLRYLTESGQVSRRELLGQLLAAGYVGGLRVSGEMEYDAKDGQGVRSVGMTAGRAFTDRVSGQITGRRSFLDDGSVYVQGNVDWNLNPVRLGLRAGYDTAFGATVGVSATTSLVRSPDDGGWLVSSRPLGNYGAALVTAFIDLDGDGAYGAGDEPLKDVGFGRNVLWQDIRTADDGQAFLPGITANQFVNVKVNLATVEDPYLVPRHEGMTTVVHQGGVSDLSFPFHYVGEIEGVVARDANLARPLRNIGLELTDPAGARVGTAVSEFDGFYLFQEIPPGDYLVSVVEATLRGRFQVPAPQPVTVPPGGDYVRGPAIVLLPLVDDEPVVVAATMPEPEPEPERSSVPAPAVANGGLPGAGGGAGTGVGADDRSGRGDGAGGSGSGSGAATSNDAASAPVIAAAGPDVAPAQASRVATPTARATGPAGEQAERASAPATPSTKTPSTKTPSTKAPASVDVAVSAPQAPAVLPAPDTLRTLHLIHELLFESGLFAPETP